MTDDNSIDQDVDLHDDNDIVEASTHDPKNAEAQSVASVDKAGEATGKAPTRKGDNTTQDPMPKTKAGIISAMVLKAQKMPKDKLIASYGAMEGVELEGEAIAESDTLADYEADFSADLNALVADEATLSEGFRAKASVIFEAALNSKLQEEVARLEESYETRLQEEIDTTKADLVEKVDGYLNYVVENWMEENRLAIHNGLRAEIAEGFMDKLKDLFTESYIEVPDSKVDLVDDLAEQVEALEEKLNVQTSNLIEMTSELELFKRYEVIREHSRGLAETEVEKLATLAEDLDFESEEAFSLKVKTIKESYFTKKPTTSQAIAEEFESEDEAEQVEVSESMAAYIQAIKKTKV